MEIEMDSQSSTRKNSTKLSLYIKRRQEAGPKLERYIKMQDVIWLLSGNSASPIFRALICKLICGWQRQAWVWERILDVIWCLTPSSFVDWSLIGNEGAAFPLWGRQGRWRLEHIDWKWVPLWWFNGESKKQPLRATNFNPYSWRKTHQTEMDREKNKNKTGLDLYIFLTFSAFINKWKKKRNQQEGLSKVSTKPTIMINMHKVVPMCSRRVWI